MSSSNAGQSTGTEKPSVSDRSMQFVPTEGGKGAGDAAYFLVAAYVLIWVCTIIFILQTWRRTRGLETKMNKLQAALVKDGSTGA